MNTTHPCTGMNQLFQTCFNDKMDLKRIIQTEFEVFNTALIGVAGYKKLI